MKNENLPISTSQKMKWTKAREESLFPFYMINLYLFLEFGRPQLLIPVLAKLHLPALTIIFMSISLLYSGKLYLKDKQTVLFILFMSEMMIHGPIAINNHWAFWIFYSMMINLIAYLSIVAFADDDTKYYKLVSVYLAVFIFLAILGYFKKGKGIGGFIGDENDFCMALNMILPFALFNIFSSKNITNKLYYVVLTGLFLLVNILTLSRGGFIGLICVGFYCWIRSNKKIALMLVMCVFVVFAIIMAPPTYWNEVRSIFTEPSNPSGTGAQRIYAWKIGWKMFLEHPILGVGQGNYPWHVNDIELKYGMQWQERSLAARAAHSLYFTLLPELGLIGTFLFISMNVYLFKEIKKIIKFSKSKKDLLQRDEARKMYFHALALEGSLIGFLTSSIFISTLYYPNFYVLCGLIVAFKNSIYKKHGELNSAHTKLKQTNTNKHVFPFSNKSNNLYIGFENKK